MDTNQIFEKLFSTLGPYVIGFAILMFLLELGPLFIKRWKNNKSFTEGSKWRSDQELLKWLRNMKPSEFENYVAHLFAKLGYNAQTVGRSHDGGVDVEIQKDGVTSY